MDLLNRQAIPDGLRRTFSRQMQSQCSSASDKEQVADLCAALQRALWPELVVLQQQQEQQQTTLELEQQAEDPTSHPIAMARALGLLDLEQIRRQARLRRHQEEHRRQLEQRKEHQQEQQQNPCNHRLYKKQRTFSSDDDSMDYETDAAWTGSPVSVARV